MNYRVVFSPEAEEQLAALYRYIAVAASPEVAARYTSAIVCYCESLNTFPHRGTKRDDVRPGLRITNYKKRRDRLCRGRRTGFHHWRVLWRAGLRNDPPRRFRGRPRALTIPMPERSTRHCGAVISSCFAYFELLQRDVRFISSNRLLASQSSTDVLDLRQGFVSVAGQ